MSNLQLMTLALPALTRYSASGSQYNFAGLTVGGPALVETNFIDAKKAHSRVSSALTAYKKRSGDKSRFTVRVAKLDGADVVGVWKLADADTSVANETHAPEQETAAA